jgi:hypothetical protein
MLITLDNEQQQYIQQMIDDRMFRIRKKYKNYIQVECYDMNEEGITSRMVQKDNKYKFLWRLSLALNNER